MADRAAALLGVTPSPLGRVDPRAKLLVMVCVMLYLFLAPSWPWLAALTASGLVLTRTAGFPAKWLAALWLVQVPNVVGLMFLPALQDLVGGRDATVDVDSGLRMSFAWLGAVATLTPLLWSMSVDEIASGLRALGVPRSATFAVAYAFRLLHATLHSAQRVADGLKAKGVDLETRNPFRLLAALPKIMTATLFVIVRRSNAMMAVLRMRGY
jgi:energy-coupling factor transport system permease protein